LTPETKAASIHVGIDEIIMKPMSPKYLVERVLARLARRTAAAGRARTSIRRKDWSSFGDNVVPLFKQQPEHVV
jgi:DNA-binding response OmpR family regulator